MDQVVNHDDEEEDKERLRVRHHFDDLGLVGRADQLHALADNSSTICFVHGPSGSGKTALVEEHLKKKGTKEGCIVCRGKMDLKNSVQEQPFWVLRQALGQWVDFISNKKDISTLYNPSPEEFSVLADFLPGFDRWFPSDVALSANERGTHQESTKSPAAAQTKNQGDRLLRLCYILKGFLKFSCEAYGPMFLFLDDLQWCDASTLELLQHLLKDSSELLPFRFIGTFRDDDGNFKDVWNLVHSLQQATAIALPPLALVHVQQIVQHVLQSDRNEDDDTDALSTWIYTKSQGNPFYIMEAFYLLQRDHCLIHTPSGWQFLGPPASEGEASEEEEIEFFEDDGIVTERMEAQLTPHILFLLQIAACLGSTFSQSTLAHIVDGLLEQKTDKLVLDTQSSLSEQSQIKNALQEAAVQGILDFVGESRYRFCHDKIQQAIYSTMPDDDHHKANLHVRLSRVLNRLRRSDNSISIFAVVDQGNRGLSAMSSLEETTDLARLNLKAAKQAMEIGALEPARHYASCGIASLAGQQTWSNQYPLTLALYNILAESTASLGHYEVMEEAVAQVLGHARSLEDKVDVLMSKIESCGQRNQYKNGLELARDLLEKLEEPLPKRPNMIHVVFALRKARASIRKQPKGFLLSLPQMEHVQKGHVMRILTRYQAHALHSQKTADLLLAMLRQFQLTIRYGLHKASPYAICAYGMVEATLGNIDAGCQYGELSLELADKIGAAEWKANCIQVFFMASAHWRRPYSLCMVQCLEGYNLGMRHGDLEFGFYNAACYCMMYYMAGLNLKPVEKDFRRYCKQMLEYKYESAYSIAAPSWQLIMNLIGKDSKDPTKLTGDAMTEEAFVRKHRMESTNIAGLQVYWVAKSQACYHFGDWREAERVLDLYGKSKSNIETHFLTILYTFFKALTHLALFRITRKARYRSRAKKTILLMKQWVTQGNINLSHKVLLLTAEYRATTRKEEEAPRMVRQLYDAAIRTAARAGFLQDAALGNELAGAHFVNDDDDDYWSLTYLHRAKRLYLEWGAAAKAKYLETKYPMIFSPSNNLSQEVPSLETASSSLTLPQRSLVGEGDALNLRHSFAMVGTRHRSVERFDPSVVQGHRFLGGGVG